MGRIESFRDLEVYRRAVEQAGVVVHVARGFPPEERFALAVQICRSARAVGGLVAEAWGRRRYESAFSNRMSEALGEATETQAWLDHALASGYIDRQTHQRLDAEWTTIASMLFMMIRKSDRFCRRRG